jgi:hypothetical protein
VGGRVGEAVGFSVGVCPPPWKQHGLHHSA